jgi:aminoglycoside 6'-N-acetyltransferase I
MFGMHIAIRTASPEDRDEWVRLRWELWPDCPAERHSLEMVQILGMPGMVALAFVDQKLTGFAEVSVRSDHVEGTVSSPVPYLEGWYVQPAHRGQGAVAR